jgi:glycosyltransferase involved in cell wall biosynthesis
VRNPWPIVRGWDLFVSLSSDEGQGLAILEAMALGVPVAAIRSAGVEDYLADGQTGFELTGVQPRRVARALADVLSDAPRLRAVSRRARRMVETRYGWTSTVEAYERVYAAVLGRSRSVAR